MLDMPKRDRIAERRESTRREILDAAWAVARESGLATLTLRDVASRVGMQAPSLYSHFASKNAIYDGMFRQAWEEFESSSLAVDAALPAHPRAAFKQTMRHFFEFAVADLARYQLMNQRILVDFEPTTEAFAPSVRVVERSVQFGQAVGISVEDHLIVIALVSGLINQHYANDPGGDTYAGLLDRSIDMWADAVGLPPEDSPPAM
ncbi:MAG: TetR/AcrR family transcriptional regulator [Aeromicrobium sp.]